MSLACAQSDGQEPQDAGGDAATDTGQDASDDDQVDGSDAGSDSPDPGCEPLEEPSVTCDDGQNNCKPIAVIGDPPAVGPGTFKGYADSAIAHDRQAADRFWLTYTWLQVVAGKALDGSDVLMAVASAHLARSGDGGRTFAFQRDLYPAILTLDPEGSGELGYLSSETVSLAAIERDEHTSWYAARLRYFLRPQNGYNPNYATSWTVRIGTASGPEHLGDAEVLQQEAVLGVSQTASAYQPDVLLDQLAGLPIQHCAMANNPALFAQGEILYLVVECLAFVGSEADHPNSTMQVFATTPSGPPPSWTWRHVGKLLDHTLAVELGVDTLLQPEISQASDGSLILIVTPAHIDTSLQVETLGEGCTALELVSLDPPLLKRDCTGSPMIRGKVAGEGFCACSHNPHSSTGIIAHMQWEGHPYTMYATGVIP